MWPLLFLQKPSATYLVHKIRQFRIEVSIFEKKKKGNPKNLVYLKPFVNCLICLKKIKAILSNSGNIIPTDRKRKNAIKKAKKCPKKFNCVAKICPKSSPRGLLGPQEMSVRQKLNRSLQNAFGWWIVVTQSLPWRPLKCPLKIKWYASLLCLLRC